MYSYEGVTSCFLEAVTQARELRERDESKDHRTALLIGFLPMTCSAPFHVAPRMCCWLFFTLVSLFGGMPLSSQINHLHRVLFLFTNAQP